MKTKNIFAVLGFVLILASCQTSQKHVAFGTGKWKQDVDLSSTRQHLSTTGQIQNTESVNRSSSNTLNEIQNLKSDGETLVSDVNKESNLKTKPVTNAALKDLNNIEKTESFKELNFIEKIAVKKAIKPIQKMVKENKSSTNYTETKLTDSEFFVALLLLVFLGALGIHRFYLGYPLYGLLMLFTAGGCGILLLIDLVLLLTGGIKRRHN